MRQNLPLKLQGLVAQDDAAFGKASRRHDVKAPSTVTKYCVTCPTGRLNAQWDGRRLCQYCGAPFDEAPPNPEGELNT